MRRRAPRPVGETLAALVDDLAPATTLARVQRVWPTVAGEAIASDAEPVAERAGVLSVTCRSAVWAQELDLMATELVERLNAALTEPGDPPPLRSLKVSAGGAGRRLRSRAGD
jgi:predicted nucleic acid-binding Zn ribbon protein